MSSVYLLSVRLQKDLGDVDGVWTKHTKIDRKHPSSKGKCCDKTNGNISTEFLHIEQLQKAMSLRTQKQICYIFLPQKRLSILTVKMQFE